MNERKKREMKEERKEGDYSSRKLKSREGE